MKRFLIGCLLALFPSLAFAQLPSFPGAPSTGITTLQSLTSPTTGNWFSTDTPRANELRWGDRIFVGDTATNYANTNACPSGNWFSAFEATTSNGPCAYIGSFQMVIESHASNSNASGGLLAAGQTKNNNANGAFGLMGFALNNNTSATGGAWAGYFECNQTVHVNTSGCLGIEIDVGNFDSSARAGNPDPFQGSDITDLHLACGSGLTTPTRFPCGVALQLTQNDQPFKVGINFLSGSIATQTIFSATLSPAISLPTNYVITWYSAAGATQGAITVDSSGNMLLAGNGVLKFNGVNINVP